MKDNPSYQLLLQQLEAFIKKYYKNLLLKGVLLCLTLILSLWLALSIMEYLGEFKTLGRTVLFYSFLSAVVVVLSSWVIWPILKLCKLGPRLSEVDAAIIIGKYFPEIDDKVLNTLQLHNHTAKSDLVLASIEQKSNELNTVSFLSVIDYSGNKKYLKFLFIPLLIFLAVMFTNSDVITKSSSRLINHTAHFEPKAPFKFVLQNRSLSALSDEDFTVELKTIGEVIPKDIYIVFDNESYRLQKTNGVYQHTFKSVQKDVSFYFTDKAFNSRSFKLVVNPKPNFTNLKLTLNYPKYTKIPSTTITNSGSATIPEGTTILWDISTKNTRKTTFIFKDTSLMFNTPSVSFKKKIKASQNYNLQLSNRFAVSDSATFSLTSIKDEYPKISLSEELDSISDNIHYFTGNITDDYGFKSLRFIWKNKTTQNKVNVVTLPVTNAFTKDTYYHVWDVSDLNLEPGQELVYYFEVFDNDGVNGSKSSKSTIKVFKAPSLDELDELAKKSNENIKNNMDKSIQDAQKMREELKKIQENLLNKKSLDFQDKQQISDFLNQQKQLEKQLEQLKQETTQKNKKQSDFKPINEELLKKQEQLEKLFEELMSEELKELYKELEELMEELNKDKIQEKLEELSQDDIEEQLDRSLELFKQLEMDEKLESITDKLEKLAEDQEKLSEESKNKDADNVELKEKQNEIDDRFKQVKEDLEELKNLNDNLENKRNLDDTKEEENAIQEDINKSKDQLEKENNKKASGSQSDAAKKMKQLQQQMAQQQRQQQKQKQEEDMSALRMLLENLITFSFDQENVLSEYASLSSSDPKYTELSREQRKLTDDAQLIKDSLIALSKRIYQIESYVTKEINDINYNLTETVDLLSERKTSLARVKQQNIMTASNNLALLLDEILQQMQQQSASQMPGTGNCQKPGGSGSSSSPSMQNLQKQLAEQLKKMKQEMKKQGGQQDGGKKGKGEKGENGEKPNGTGGAFGQGGQGSKELARMAAQQEAIRKEIQRLAQELNKDGSGNGNGLNKIAEELEKNEEDIINKNITQELINRQENIITRLLEHEKAEREQEFDDKKESEKVKNQKFSNPTKYLEYKRMKEKEIELLKTIPLDLNEYYKNKVNEFFNTTE